MNEEEQLKNKIVKKLLSGKSKTSPIEKFINERVKKTISEESVARKERDRKTEEKRKAEKREANELLKKVISEIEERKIKTIIEEIRKIKFEVPEIEAPEMPKELVAEMRKGRIDYGKIVDPIIRELMKKKELKISEIVSPLPISEVEEKTYEILSEILKKESPTILQLRNKEGKVISPATEDTLKTLVKRMVVRIGRGIDKSGMKAALEEERATTPTIYNKVMPSSNTEYSQTLPEGTRKLKVKLRDYKTLKFAFASGKSGSNYFTLPTGATYPEEGIHLSGKTLYFQSPTASQTCEIICWT